MMRAATPNTMLRDLMTEAGWTGAQLSRQVNRLTGEAGLMLRLDRRAPSNWLAGRRPRPPIPDLVAEALSRRLGRPVRAADTGLVRQSRKTHLGRGENTMRLPHMGANQTPAAVSIQSSVDAVTMLRQLTNHDRRPILAGGTYSLALLAVPAWVNITGTVRDVDSDSKRPTGRLTPGQVQAAEQMTVVFADADTVFGGGHSRLALGHYLSQVVTPWLRADATPRNRARMRSAATRLTYLCGFMCFDDERHPLAQRYYLTALRLATESGDPAAYALVLRAMSVQARMLGHHREAVQLAETAATTSRNHVSPLRRAFMIGQLAVAAAADGDRSTALSALSTAERQVERATSQHPPPPTHPKPGPVAEPGFGDYDRAALAHQQAAVRALLGDRSGAITALQDSIRHRPAVQRRSRAIITARLAELHLAQGHLEQAATTWHAFLNDYPHLNSGRATTALKIMRSSLQPHRNTTAGKAALTQAAAY